MECHDKILEQEVRQLEKEFAALVGILRSEKIITDRHMESIFPLSSMANTKSCLNCDQFGIGCGDCEVSDDD